jgi:hypothetical protein
MTLSMIGFYAIVRTDPAPRCKCVSPSEARDRKPFGRRRGGRRSSLSTSGQKARRWALIEGARRRDVRTSVVSIEGGAYQWLRAGLEPGDLAGRDQLPPDSGRLNRAAAASVVVLMAATREPAYERAAVRVAIAAGAERPRIALDHFVTAAAALKELRRSARACAELATICAQQRIATSSASAVHAAATGSVRALRRATSSQAGG